MPSITGTYYDGQSSRPYPTSLEVNEEGFARLAGVDRDLVHFGELDVPSRVGNTPRCVGWPGGGVFETTDHATLDGWVTRFGTRGRDHILHKLERNLWVILPLLAVTALVVYLMVTQFLLVTKTQKKQWMQQLVLVVEHVWQLVKTHRQCYSLLLRFHTWLNCLKDK